MNLGMKPATIRTRILSRVIKIRGCWLHQGFTKQGYAIVRYGKRYRTAHRVFYEMEKGPINRGLVLDHKCRNRRCINPKHLEPVTNKVNILRGNGAGAINARRTHCKHGHKFTKKSTYTIPGTKFRYCRKCMARRTKEWALRK